MRKGDALLVRTGHLTARRGAWGGYAGGAAPGRSLHTTTWLHEHEIAALATDTCGVEVRPNEIDVFQPFHLVALVHMGLALGEIFDLDALAEGLALGEIFDLDALAEDCAADRRYTFMLAATPLPRRSSFRAAAAAHATSAHLHAQLGVRFDNGSSIN